MVATNEAVMAKRKQEREADERRAAGELDDFDQAIAGRTMAQLRIPLDSIYTLRHEVDLMRGMLDRLEFLAHREDLDPRTVMIEARLTIKATAGKLLRLRSPGRPRKEG